MLTSIKVMKPKSLYSHPLNDVNFWKDEIGIDVVKMEKMEKTVGMLTQH